MIRYQPTLLARKHNSDQLEYVYWGLKYYDTYEEAENDALDNRCHPKEIIEIREIEQLDNPGIVLK